MRVGDPSPKFQITVSEFVTPAENETGVFGLVYWGVAEIDAEITCICVCIGLDVSPPSLLCPFQVIVYVPPAEYVWMGLRGDEMPVVE